MKKLKPILFEENLFSLQTINKESIDNKIIIEKRKRFQLYNALDYILSMTTYFDFFSEDAFLIVLNAISLTSLSKKRLVTTEDLLFCFFIDEKNIKKILNDFFINHSNNLIKSKESKSSIKQKKGNIFFSVYKNFKEVVFKFSNLLSNEKEFDLFLNDFSYSYELLNIFEKATENALIRFKTPIITPEILFITLMEEERTKANLLIKKIIKREKDFYLLRFKLLKKLHNEENLIKSDIKTNYLYFAYLLKSQLSELEFKTLCENNYHPLGIFYFRNFLIQEILKIDLSDLIIKDIYTSIHKSSKRHFKT
jgi:hypothetical protein